MCLFWSGLAILLLNTYVPASLFGISIDIHKHLLKLIQPLLNDPDVSAKLAWIIIIAVAMHLYALINVGFTNHIYSRIVRKISGVDYKTLQIISILVDSPLDKELLHSYLTESPILITLSNRKVYVGRVISVGEPTENEGLDQEITLLPQMSGYRHKDTLNVDFTTHYQNISTVDEMTVTIRQELIETISRFDFEVYKQFLQNQEGNRTKSFRERMARRGF
jgi:hypothetical protein